RRSARTARCSAPRSTPPLRGGPGARAGRCRWARRGRVGTLRLLVRVLCTHTRPDRSALSGTRRRRLGGGRKPCHTPAGRLGRLRPMLEALREPRRALALAGAYRSLAERALEDEQLGTAEGLGVLAAPDDALAAVLWAAYAVRARHFGRRVKLCVL